MFVRCTKCGYETGDFDTLEAINLKVVIDGGKSRQLNDPTDECPKCHEKDTFTLD